MIRVLVVDDHRLVRAGLVTLLQAAGDIEIAGEAADGHQALEMARTERPDVVLMDLSMPGLDGVGATAQLCAELPAARVIALTSFSDRQRVTDVLAAGAVGYLLKDCAPDELLGAVRAAAAGHTPLDARVAGALLPSRTPPVAQRLSDRECDVLRLVASGWRTSRSRVPSALPRALSRRISATSSGTSASRIAPRQRCGPANTSRRSRPDNATTGWDGGPG